METTQQRKRCAKPLLTKYRPEEASMPETAGSDLQDASFTMGRLAWVCSLAQAVGMTVESC